LPFPRSSALVQNNFKKLKFVRHLTASLYRVSAGDRSARYRQCPTNALGMSERAKQHRQAQAYCNKAANVFEVG
jgi:hypothetical protein